MLCKKHIWNRLAGFRTGSWSWIESEDLGHLSPLLFPFCPPWAWSNSYESLKAQQIHPSLLPSHSNGHDGKGFGRSWFWSLSWNSSFWVTVHEKWWEERPRTISDPDIRLAFKRWHVLLRINQLLRDEDPKQCSGVLCIHSLRFTWLFAIKFSLSKIRLSPISCHVAPLCRPAETDKHFSFWFP